MEVASAESRVSLVSVSVFSDEVWEGVGTESVMKGESEEGEEGDDGSVSDVVVGNGAAASGVACDAAIGSRSTAGCFDFWAVKRRDC